MTPSGESNSRPAVEVGSVWRHKRDGTLLKEVRRITDIGKVLGPGTSRSGRSVSVRTLERDYDFVGMRCYYEQARRGDVA